MIKLAYSNVAQRGDLVRGTGNLELDQGLETAVTISLFSDARAADDDPIEATIDKRGWWGAQYLDDERPTFGSKLWQLARVGKASEQTMNQAVAWAEDALRWLIEDRVAETVIVTAAKLRPDVLLLTVDIQRPRKTAPRWRGVWEVQLAL